MKEKKPTLVLLDAHAIIHRAYHALPQFTNSAGEPTGALYGVVSMILKIIEDFQPDYVVACYDLPGKTFRHEAYTAYKGTRGEAEQDLIMQLQSSRTIMEAFAIPMYDAPGFEADDMLGTITEQLKDTDIRIVIASGDMDTLQLVRGDRVQVFTLRKGIKDTVVYNEDAVRDRFGFAPELLIDYKGLRGDTSDNIPGIKGIGEKNSGDVDSKIWIPRRSLCTFGNRGWICAITRSRHFRQNYSPHHRRTRGCFFSKTLATIRTDAPITFTLPEHIWQTELDPDAVREICHRYEFRSLWKRVEDMFAGQSAAPLAPAEDIDLREIQETGIALWLLNSEITHPTKDDILQYAQIHSFADARAYIFKELEQKNLFAVYQEIEAPLIPVIERMEGRGLLLDVPYFKALSQKYHTELDNFERKIFDMAGMTFNIKSPKQLGEVLFDHMGISTKGLKKNCRRKSFNQRIRT
ncbi:MAG: hypothetical protein LRY41_01540 [Candidatus Pacebacteria bacterium]|nr:hypothetical protein [Candidatus Paceibacterota bacterium]